MFSYLYSTKMYNFLKSGMLLDFMIKKLVFGILYNFYFYSNVMFSEKYFVEHIYIRVEKFLNQFFKITEFFQKNFSITSLALIGWFIFFLIFFLV